ncbi:hypothetical protein KIPB_002179, partial [Kipferlia bialata]
CGNYTFDLPAAQDADQQLYVVPHNATPCVGHVSPYHIVSPTFKITTDGPVGAAFTSKYLSGLLIVVAVNVVASLVLAIL